MRCLPFASALSPLQAHAETNLKHRPFSRASLQRCFPAPRSCGPRRAGTWDRLGAATNTCHELRSPHGLISWHARRMALGCRGCWGPRDDALGAGTLFQAFASRQRAVERGAAHTSPPWVLRACFCFPGEKRLEGVETTRDAVKTAWLLEVGMFCGDIGNPSGRGALSDGGVKRHLPPWAPAQQPPGAGGSDPAAGSRQRTPPIRTLLRTRCPIPGRQGG